MSIQQDTIKRFVNTLIRTNSTGVAAADEAVAAATNGLLTSWGSLVDYFVGTVASHGGTDATGYTYSSSQSKFVPTDSTHAYLTNYCGIDLTNEDTGSLTGSDAGSGISKTAESIVPENVTGIYYPTSSTSTYRGLTINWPTGALDATAQKVVAGLYTWWGKECLDLVAETYGISYADDTAKTRSMTLDGYYNDNSSTLASASSQTLSVNLAKYRDLDLSDGNGRSSSGYLDRTLAHEFTHAVMCANMNVNTWNSLLSGVCEGLAELVHGIDDFRFSEICNLAQSNSAPALRSALFSTGGDYNSYAAGYMLFRFLGHQMALNSSGSNGSTGGETSSHYSYTGGDATITDYDPAKRIYFDAQYSGLDVAGDSLQLHSAAGTLTVQNCRDKLISVADGGGNIAGYAYMAGSPQTMDYSAHGPLEVLVGSNNGSDYILAGSGGSSQWGGSGSVTDTMQGGGGADTFFYGANEGTDYIQGSNAADQVMLYSAMGIQALYMNGSDLVIHSSDSDKLIVNGWNEGGMNTFRLWDGSVYGLHNDNGSISAYRKA